MFRAMSNKYIISWWSCCSDVVRVTRSHYSSRWIPYCLVFIPKFCWSYSGTYDFCHRFAIGFCFLYTLPKLSAKITADYTGSCCFTVTFQNQNLSQRNNDGVVRLLPVSPFQWYTAFVNNSIEPIPEWGLSCSGTCSIGLMGYIIRNCVL